MSRTSRRISTPSTFDLPYRSTALACLLVLAACAPTRDADEEPITEGDASGAAGEVAGVEGRSGEPATPGSVDGRPYIVAGSDAAAGRYLAVVGGCNDCHTEGYLQTEGDVPEEAWLAGSRLGWRGPWGTTYAANLRLRVAQMTEDDWVRQIHERHANPPMPWMNVNQMSDRDARALYRYIDSLGPLGEPVPSAVPPGEEPSTPYLSLVPQNVEAVQGG